MIRKYLAYILIGTMFLIAGCSHEPTPEETTVTSIGEKAPSFSLPTLAGEQFDLEQLEGKVVLVNFWATWCPPCREEIPHLESQVWQRFKDHEFAMIAVSREEDEATVRPFVEANDMSFPVGVDEDRSVYALYAEQYIPRTVVIAHDGTILFQSSGYEEEEFAHMISVIEEAVDAIPKPRNEESTI